MNLTEIQTKLVHGRRDKLRAFATITLDDCLVIRDLKIIEGPRGLFVAMPSRRVQERCSDCGCKNHVRARYCNECGRRQEPRAPVCDPRGRARLYADIAHPIHRSGREEIQRCVIEAYGRELERSRRAGYVPAAFDGIDAEDLPPVRRS